MRIISTLPNFTIGEHSDFNPSDPSPTARNSPFTESKFFPEAYSYPSIIVAGMKGEKKLTFRVNVIEVIIRYKTLYIISQFLGLY